MLTLTAIAAIGTIIQGAPPAEVTFDLDNGVRVIVLDIPGTDAVAVEAFVDVGIADDPAGMPQATHLIEHILCKGATPAHEAGDVWDQFHSLGMFNAETMGSQTHFDMTFPPDRLEWALGALASALGSVHIDEAIIEQEYPRCAAELTGVESIPSRPVAKFALMAAHQVWSHAGTSLTIKRRPDAIDADHLLGVQRRLYTPASLTLVIVGDVRPPQVRKIASETLGRLTESDPPPPGSADILALPPVTTATWDSTSPVAIVAFAPPTDPFERAVLTFWSVAAYQQLSMNPAIKQQTDSLQTNMTPFPVGDTPLFVLGVPAEGTDTQSLADKLLEQTLALNDPSMHAMHASIISTFAASTLSVAPPDADKVTASAKRSIRTGMGDASQMTRLRSLAMLQYALQRGMRQSMVRAWGQDSVARLKALAADELGQILDRTLTRERARVLILNPA